MRYSVVPFLLISSLCFFQQTYGDAADEDALQRNITKIDQPTLSDHLFQENPHYILKNETTKESHKKPKKKSSKKKKNGSKSAIDRALGRISNSSPRKILHFMIKNQLKIMLALTMIAFRREIAQIIWHMVSKPYRDPETGKVSRIPIKISPTSILKMMLFINFMRRMHSLDSGRASPMHAILMAGAQGNPAMSILLAKLLAFSNSAYLPPIEQHFTFERINERYEKDGLAFKKALDPFGQSSNVLLRGNATKISHLFSGSHGLTERQKYNSTAIVMDLTGLDASVSQISTIRDEVSFLLSEYRSQSLPLHHYNDTSDAKLEVIVLLESSGGSAPDYALASQQIIRLRNEPGINVTILVDKVAASGGYMIACTASPGRLFAAPFAVLGSIGVIGQTLNVQKTLEGYGIRPLVFRAGKNKAPVGLIGEITKEGMAKVQDMLDDTHRAFKRHVAQARPNVAENIDELANGDVWLGYDALGIGLIDRIVSSDEYIFERIKEGARVLKLVQLVKPKYPFQRPSTSVSSYASDRSRGGRLLFNAIDGLQAFLGTLIGHLDILRNLQQVGEIHPKTNPANINIPQMSL